ncbi:hypothetical protein [Hymenobacter mucosus]|uniref:Uncharacterized protein n=1 Tax=Hymenobacter mucosus TaxID=1411120 RepID=A0A238WW35_9BACT|nr:hypothetical protein [Hymenobacter mucosus]SNR50727.1 hypothetical protein SAMN06269173_103177 [Hymenobacter mucosus]
MLTALLLTSATSLSAALLYAAALLGPDQQGPRNSSRQQAEINPTATAHTAGAPSRSGVTTARLVRLTNDSLAGQPFGAEPTVAELLLDGGKVVARRPCRNLHEAGQVDTVLLLRHQGNTFEFYRAAEKDLLRDAAITNFQPSYARRLRTRMEAAHRPAMGVSEQLRIGDTERTNYVSVLYQGGRLSAVHVEPYLD